MTGLCPVCLMIDTRQLRLFVRNVGKFFQPVCPEAVQIVPEHFLVVREHIIFRYGAAELPFDPFGEPFGLRRSAVTSGLFYGIKISRLFIFRQLPYIGFNRTSDNISVKIYPGIPVKYVPFIFGKKPEHKLCNVRILHIKKMPASDIKWISVHIPAAA